MHVSEAVTLLLQSMKTRRNRQNYVKELNRVLMRFAEHTGDPPLAHLKPEQIESFIFRTPSPGGQQTTRNRLSALFSFAVQRRLIDRGPLETIAKPLPPETRPPSILSVDQARALLLAATRRPRALAWIILGLFVGLRPSEAQRTSWEDIRFQSGTLLVHGENSKTRRHRIIDLKPSAIRWLSVARSAGSELPIRQQPIRRELRRLRPVLSLDKWPQDVLRHTCASYDLAISQDFTRTAWQLGNSEKILLRHYYRVTDRDSAVAFWQILPTDHRQLELF
jgi:integrase